MRVEVPAFFLGALALPAGGPGQGAGGDLHAGQPLDDWLGFGRGHFADDECGDFLHAGGFRALVGQAQQGAGGKAPLFAAPAVAASALNADVAPAGLHGGAVACGQATEFVLAVRTEGRSGQCH